MMSSFDWDGCGIGRGVPILRPVVLQACELELPVNDIFLSVWTVINHISFHHNH